MEKFKPYSQPNIERAILVIILLYSICVVFLLSSCSIAKKTEKAYTGVASYSPLTSKDSTNFYKRAKDLIKPPKPSVVPSRTIKVPYPVTVLKKVLDTSIERMIIDSLEAAYKEYEKYNVEDCDMRVKKALDAGYARGQYECFINGRDSLTPEIQYVLDSSTIALLDDTNVKLRQSQAEVIKVSAQDEIYKAEAKNRLWLIILLSSGLLLSIYLHLKKYFTPTSAIQKLKNMI